VFIFTSADDDKVAMRYGIKVCVMLVNAASTDVRRRGGIYSFIESKSSGSKQPIQRNASALVVALRCYELDCLNE